jgi:peroxiredoxin
MMRVLSCSLLVAVLLVVPSAWALSSGSKAPDIGLTDLSGRNVSLASLSGKVVLVDFWASWCKPCEEELPVLERLYARYKKDGFVIVGVSVDKDASKVSRFLRRTKLSFPIVHDANGVVAERYRPEKMPSSYLVNRAGMVSYVQKGFRQADAATLESEINKALAP